MNSFLNGMYETTIQGNKIIITKFPDKDYYIEIISINLCIGPCREYWDDSAQKTLEEAIQEAKEWAMIEDEVQPTKAQIDRFLSWKLPADFAPDCGISFAQLASPKWAEAIWPIGTNLLTHEQARQMLSHVLKED
jgi:hypothetical protein